MKVARPRIAKAIVEDLNKPQLSREVAAYLLTENRVGELDSVMRDVMELRAQQGIVEVLANSAFTFTDEIRSQIQAEVKRVYPNAKQIIVSELLDENVVGGVRLQFANRQLDLSIRSKLNQLKQLTGRNV